MNEIYPNNKTRLYIIKLYTDIMITDENVCDNLLLNRIQ